MIEVIVNLVPHGNVDKTKPLYKITLGNWGSTGGYDSFEYAYKYRVYDIETPLNNTDGIVSHIRSKHLFSLLAHLFVSILDTRYLRDFDG